jgi:hypothetical protein
VAPLADSPPQVKDQANIDAVRAVGHSWWLLTILPQFFSAVKTKQPANFETALGSRLGTGLFKELLEQAQSACGSAKLTRRAMDAICNFAQVGRKLSGQPSDMPCRMIPYSRRMVTPWVIVGPYHFLRRR